MLEINIESEIFPNILKNIQKPPTRLYIEGNKDLFNTNAIAVIGSRHHSGYGERMCRIFVKELVSHGITIISGLASGIDSIAHKTCLENGGKTIAVLPCGFNYIYPKNNKGLYKDIINLGGLAVTEYEPNTEAVTDYFLQRNRIVCGLALGTLVIEAGYRSGTSVTARLTLEQDKNVFCVPSSLENEKGITSNQIIQKGGKLVTCVEDILEEYPYIETRQGMNSKKDANIYKESKVDKKYVKVYNVLGYKPIHINEIVKQSKLATDEVNYELTMLEIEGKIIQLPGKEFVRK